MLKSLVTILILFAVQFSALAQTVIPIPTRPTFPLERPTQAGELCTMALDPNVAGKFPQPPSKDYITNVVACAGGAGFILVLRLDGTVRAWGDNTYGQCNVPAGLSNVVAIAASSAFSMALKEDGTLVTWSAQLTNVPKNLRVVAIAAADTHVVVLMEDGTVVTSGTPYEETTVPRTWTNMVAISASSFRTIGLRADGVPLVAGGIEWTPWNAAELNVSGISNITAVSIGAGVATMLDTSGGVIFRSDPSNNSFFDSRIPFKSKPNLKPVKAVASGYFTSFAVMTDGSIEAWGNDFHGECEPTSQGLRNIIAIAPGAQLFIRKPTPPLDLPRPQRPTRGGNVVAWGITVLPSTPLTNVVQAIPDQAHSMRGGVFLRADGTVISSNAPPGLSNVVKVGRNFALCADGTVVNWGTNFSGTHVTPPPGLSNVVDVAERGLYFIGLLRDGSMIDWPQSASLPLNPEPVVALVQGSSHVSALRPDGTVISWGVSPGFEFYYPVITPLGLSNVVSLTAADGMSAAIKADGNYVVWGHVYRWVVDPPAGLTNVGDISAFTVLTRDGRVFDWDPDQHYSNPWNPWRPPPSGFASVISVGPECAIVDGSADTPSAHESIQTTPSVVTLHISSIPYMRYQISANHIATNEADSDLHVSTLVVATNTTLAVQFVSVPGVVYEIIPNAGIATPTIVNGQVVSITLPPSLMLPYTTPPTVRFETCSATVRSTASAVLENGILTGIQVTNPGSGWDPNCTPIVSFTPPDRSPPPYYKTIDQFTVTRSVTPGHFYQFDTSTNLIDWTSVTPAAMAQTNRLSLDVPATNTHTFYRLTEFR